MNIKISFLKMLEEVIQCEQADKKAFYKNYEFKHNPSSASCVKNGRVYGNCLRQLFYKATKVQESNPTDFTGFLQMGFGDAIHTWVLGKLAKSKAMQFSSEVAGKVVLDPLTKEISYRLDGIALLDGRRGCFELKTQQNFAIQRMLKEGLEPKTDHMSQVLTYFGTDPSLEWCSLVYVARDSALRLEFLVWKDGDRIFTQSILPEGRPKEFTLFTFDDIKERFKALEEAVKENKVPKRDYHVVYNLKGEIVDKRQKNNVEYKSDFRCMYCSYKDYCWSQPDAKKDAIKIGGE